MRENDIFNPETIENTGYHFVNYLQKRNFPGKRNLQIF